MKYLLTTIFLMAITSSTFAKEDMSFKCSSKNPKKNEVDLKIKGEFKFGREERALSDIVSDVDANFKIKAELNNSTLTDNEVAFSEKVSGHSKKLDFKFLFISKNNASLNIKIKNVTKGFEYLECKIN